MALFHEYQQSTIARQRQQELMQAAERERSVRAARVASPSPLAQWIRRLRAAFTPAEQPRRSYAQ
jgi:hypothetical protein